MVCKLQIIQLYLKRLLSIQFNIILLLQMNKKEDQQKIRLLELQLKRIQNIFNTQHDRREIYRIKCQANNIQNQIQQIRQVNEDMRFGNMIKIQQNNEKRRLLSSISLRQQYFSRINEELSLQNTALSFYQSWNSAERLQRTNSQIQIENGKLKKQIKILNKSINIDRKNQPFLLIDFYNQKQQIENKQEITKVQTKTISSPQESNDDTLTREKLQRYAIKEHHDSLLDVLGYYSWQDFKVIRLNYMKLTDSTLCFLLESLCHCSLTTMSLSYNEISLSQQKIFNFKSMIKLQVLEMQYNKIGYIPQSIEQIRSLKQLNLTQNKISCIPNNLFKNRNLIDLKISLNKIESLPKSIIKSELLFLDISLNLIKHEIPAEIISIQKIKKLILSVSCFKKKIKKIDSQIKFLRSKGIQLQFWMIQLKQKE